MLFNFSCLFYLLICIQVLPFNMYVILHLISLYYLVLLYVVVIMLYVFWCVCLYVWLFCSYYIFSCFIMFKMLLLILFLCVYKLCL